MIEHLTPDELLTTTRAVRKRLDFDRPVETSLLEECLQIAAQAPTASNSQGWHFIFVNDPEKKKAIGDIYRRGWEWYIRPTRGIDPNGQTTMDKVANSANYLAERMHEVPIMFIPCIERPQTGEISHLSIFQASMYGSILQAAWSFMLAARARGLGTCWTTLHLLYEEEAAEILGIPYETVAQTALIPVAYYKGKTFKPAPRKSLSEVIHFNKW